VLLDVKAHLGATLVVIEHDVPLVTSLSDRLLAMGEGRILAIGAPTEVLGNDEVVKSYLGGRIEPVDAVRGAQVSTES